jgi:hypothetical protein
VGRLRSAPFQRHRTGARQDVDGAIGAFQGLGPRLLRASIGARSGPELRIVICQAADSGIDDLAVKVFVSSYG